MEPATLMRRNSGHFPDFSKCLIDARVTRVLFPAQRGQGVGAERALDQGAAWVAQTRRIVNVTIARSSASAAELLRRRELALNLGGVHVDAAERLLHDALLRERRGGT